MSPRQSARSGAKSQRWIDLITALLDHRYPRTFEEIARDVPGYLGKSKDASKRMFERDKAELKALGIPIEAPNGEGDAEAGYRLRSTDFYMPYLALVTPRGRTTPRKVDRYGYQAIRSLAFEADELRDGVQPRTVQMANDSESAVIVHSRHGIVGRGSRVIPSPPGTQAWIFAPDSGFAAVWPVLQRALHVADRLLPTLQMAGTAEEMVEALAALNETELGRKWTPSRTPELPSNCASWMRRGLRSPAITCLSPSTSPRAV